MSSNPDTSANVAKAQEHAAGLAETAKNSEVCISQSRRLPAY